MKDYTYQFLIIKEPEDPGYYATCPQLPGCFSAGDTVEETLENMHEAIQLFLETLAELGDPIPDPNPGQPIVVASTTVSLAA